MLMRPWKGACGPPRETGVCDTALILWDCPGTAHSRAGHARGHTRGKETFLKSCSSSTTRQNRSDLLHFGFNTAMNEEEVP